MLAGIGCAIVSGVRVGDWTTIGAGAAVVGDVADDLTVTWLRALAFRAPPAPFFYGS